MVYKSPIPRPLRTATPLFVGVLAVSFLVLTAEGTHAAPPRDRARTTPTRAGARARKAAPRRVAPRKPAPRKAAPRTPARRKAKAGRRGRRKAPASRKTAGRLPDASWLTKDAEIAINRGNLPKAVALYRGAAALRNQEPRLIYRLAEIYRMAGQFAEATQEFRRFIQVSKNAKKKAEAEAAIKAMREMPTPFVDRETRIKVDVRFQALTAFRRGRRDAKFRNFRRAILHFQTALMLDPKLIGALRWLGQMYTRIKAPQQAAEYYSRYLRIMPVGPNAAIVRARLKGYQVFGKLNLTASYPCEVWINQMPLTGRKTPIKGLEMPEGEYTVIFYNRKYKVGRKIRITVRTGQTETEDFSFGILEVKLNPWARTRADGRDIGLWPQVGIPARTKPYELKIVSFDGKKRMTKSVVIAPGKTVSITKWQ